LELFDFSLFATRAKEPLDPRPHERGCKVVAKGSDAQYSEARRDAILGPL
jgi:hypothetical protein